MLGALALLTALAHGATPPLAVTLEDRTAADAVIAALVARGDAVQERDDGQAPLVLGGHSRWEDVRSELLGPTVHRVDLALSLRLVRRADGRVIGTFELSGRGLGVTRDAATRHAAREATRGLAEGVSAAVARAGGDAGATGAEGPTRRDGAVRATDGARAASAARGDGAARSARGARGPDDDATDASAPPTLTFEPRTAVSLGDDPRGLRVHLGDLRLAGAPTARHAHVDARPLALGVETTTIPPSADGQPVSVPVMVSLDPEVALRRTTRTPTPLRAWLDHDDAGTAGGSADVLPVDAERALLWLAHHRLLAGRAAAARPLYAEAVARGPSPLRALALFGAAAAARADRDLAAAGALIADCLAERPAECTAWVEAWARGPAEPPLGWSP